MTALEDLWYGNINPHETFLNDNCRFKLRYLKRAKGVRHVGSVPSYWDGGKLIILKDDLMKCLFGPDGEEGK